MKIYVAIPKGLIKITYPSWMDKPLVFLLQKCKFDFENYEKKHKKQGKIIIDDKFI